MASTPPESSQTCLDETGQKWRCGQAAALALQDLIGRRTVTCDERNVDRYGRIVSRCLVGQVDINQWLVAQGLVLRTGDTPATTWPPKRRLAQWVISDNPLYACYEGSGRGGEHHRQDQVVRAGDLIGSCRRRLAKAFSIRALSLRVPTNT